jgi:hypothetical protein
MIELRNCPDLAWRATADYGPNDDDDRCGGAGGLHRRLHADRWVRSNANTADLERERFECQYEAIKIAASAEMGAADEGKRSEFEAICMQAKGWSRQRAGI